MSVGVIDAGVAIGWLHGGHRSGRRLDALLAACRKGKSELYLSTVNLAEVLIHTREWTRSTGGDAVVVLRAAGVRFHHPDESIARRVAKLQTSLADGFAAATAQELGGRLHTTDSDLVRRLKRSPIPVSHY